MNYRPSVVVFAILFAILVAPSERRISAQGGAAARSTVTGRVLNSDGTPAAAVAVGVLASENPQCVPAAYGVQAGRGSFSSLAAYGMTDGAGRYRLDNIPSGRYYLVAGTFSLPGQAAPPCWVQARYTGYIAQPSYHPGVADLSMAALLVVNTTDLTFPDLRLPTGSGFKITGRVVGAPVVAPGLRLIVRLGNPGNVPANGPCRVFRGSIGPDGSFELRDVPPCNYSITVMVNAGDAGSGAFPGSGGTANVNVVDKDITGISLGP